MLAKILLVEDNPLTAKGLQYLLEREKYQVETIAEARAAQAAVLDGVDLILLDVALPDGDGFSLAKQFKAERPEIPIIFLTAKDEAENIIRGLELGADDYIVKPFHNRELLLRIQKTLRQTNRAAANLSFEDIELDLENHSAEVNGRVVALTALEYKILHSLMETPEKIVTREKLLDEIWAASGKIVNDNTISVYVKRLRQKIGNERIATVKNLGYRLVRKAPENVA